MQNDFQSALEKEQSNILPVLTFQSEDLMEKLKMLNFEKQLLRDLKIKCPSKLYFVKSSNPGEQFHMFTSICAWLIRKLGKNFDQPEEFDDPNKTISNILSILQEIDIPTDFPSNKLIQGAGPICLFVLDSLATQALKISKISLNHPQIKHEEENVPEFVETDAEVILEKVEEEQNIAAFSDDSDDNGNDGISLNWHSNKRQKSALVRQNASSTFNFDTDNFNETENWRLEVERVLPQLKVIVKSDTRDWRAHLKQMEALKENIEASTEDTQIQLKKLQSDITFAMDKIENREKHLSNDLQPSIRQLKDYSIELSNVQISMKEIDDERLIMSKELSDIINENDNVKGHMEQRGQSMSDGSPIINIKKAITKLRDEIAYINLEIGLLNHSIDQDIVRQASLYVEIQNSPTIVS